MNASTAERFTSLRSQGRDARYRAFMQLLEATQTPVDWAYEVLDDIVRDLEDDDNHMGPSPPTSYATSPRATLAVGS